MYIKKDDNVNDGTEIKGVRWEEFNLFDETKGERIEGSIVFFTLASGRTIKQVYLKREKEKESKVYLPSSFLHIFNLSFYEKLNKGQRDFYYKKVFDK